MSHHRCPAVHIRRCWHHVELPMVWQNRVSRRRLGPGGYVRQSHPEQRRLEGAITVSQEDQVPVADDGYIEVSIAIEIANRHTREASPASYRVVDRGLKGAVTVSQEHTDQFCQPTRSKYEVELPIMIQIPRE